MKVAVVSVVFLNVASAYAMLLAPYKIYQVKNESLWNPETRIYGDNEAPEGKFPFMIFALIYTPQGIARCSASLIEPSWVLIAAHCIDINGMRPSFIFLVGGKANLVQYVKTRLGVIPTSGIDEKALGVQEIRAEKFFIHPDYDVITMKHDIALIRLKKPFDLNGVETISISQEKMIKPKLCTILGWGLTPENALNYKLNYANNKMVYTTEEGCKYKLKEPFLCLEPGGSGICSGDSGGPLVCNNKVWGVASHLVYETFNECGKSLEEYYSEVHPDLYWINTTLHHKYGNGGNPSAVMSLANMFILTGFWLFLRSSLDTYK